MMPRRAFTLVELIIMIVVLGIAFATLPAILGVSAKSVRGVSEVRGLYHGVAKMQVVLNKPWDEVNVNDFDTGGGYFVLRTFESDTQGEVLFCDGDKNRSGHYPGLDRRMCENADATAANLFTAEGDFDDLDDFDGDNDADIGGFDVNTTVVYVAYAGGSPVNMPTAGTAQTSNIKEITVTVSDHATGTGITRYRYYATNIGLSRPYIKRND